MCPSFDDPGSGLPRSYLPWNLTVFPEVQNIHRGGANCHFLKSLIFLWRVVYSPLSTLSWHVFGYDCFSLTFPAHFLLRSSPTSVCIGLCDATLLNIFHTILHWFPLESVNVHIAFSKPQNSLQISIPTSVQRCICRKPTSNATLSNYTWLSFKCHWQTTSQCYNRRIEARSVKTRINSNFFNQTLHIEFL